MKDRNNSSSLPDASFSRRALLKTSAAALALTTLAGRATAATGKYVFIASSYNSDTTLNGISTYTKNTNTGVLTRVQFVANPNNPSWLTLNASGTVLYAGCEVSPGGGVAAYRVNSDGSLSFINFASSSNPDLGAGPAHISVHPSGKYILTASWVGAYLSVMPILSDGSVGTPTDTIVHTGDLGPGQTQAHPHMFQADPTASYCILQDLGQDRTYIYALDLDTGMLNPGPTPYVQSQPGSGPRHFAFHPDGVHMYSINEVNSTINVYLWTASTGSLLLQETLSTLPTNYTGAHGVNTCAEIAVSSDGNYVYGSNRTYDSIVQFSARRYGPNLVGAVPSWTWTQGETPRQFALSPDGKFLYAGNQNAAVVTVFRINPLTGDLTPTGDFIGVAGPTCVLFQ